MSNDNRSNLKAHHGQHSEKQEHKSRQFFFIVYMLLMTFLITSLLIPSCQHSDKQAADKIQHDDMESK